MRAGTLSLAQSTFIPLVLSLSKHERLLALRQAQGERERFLLCSQERT